MSSKERSVSPCFYCEKWHIFWAVSHTASASRKANPKSAPQAKTQPILTSMAVASSDCLKRGN